MHTTPTDIKNAAHRMLSEFYGPKYTFCTSLNANDSINPTNAQAINNSLSVSSNFIVVNNSISATSATTATYATNFPADFVFDCGEI